MSLIESNVRGDGQSLHDSYRNRPSVNRGEPISVSVVMLGGEERRYALSAAELASIESEKTKEKLKSKADHVTKFHRKVVRRLAEERRDAHANASDSKARQTGPIYTYANVGSSFEPSALTLADDKRALWEEALSSNETLHYQAVKVIGERGDVCSLSDADAGARIALGVYRTP